MGLFDFFKKKEKKDSLDLGLRKTRDSFLSRLAGLITGKKSIDPEVLDNLEELLISSDVGVDTTRKIIQRIEVRVKSESGIDPAKLDDILRDEVASLLEKSETGSSSMVSPLPGMPFVMMVVGVNGVGKTTTIGKLACKLQAEGKQVMLAAADTFRAAATDQLGVWAGRAGAKLTDMGMGADPASVAFEALKVAVAEKCDVVLVDTAGRLHNKIGLMNELSKIKRVMSKVIPGAPHEVLLVLDGSTGQNAFEQCRQFSQATEVTALAVTKLDGTAKGGVVIGISDTFKVPVKFIGVGEKPEDLQVFDRENFVDSLFSKNLK